MEKEIQDRQIAFNGFPYAPLGTPSDNLIPKRMLHATARRISGLQAIHQHFLELNFWGTCAPAKIRAIPGSGILQFPLGVPDGRSSLPTSMHTRKAAPLYTNAANDKRNLRFGEPL